MTNLSACTMKLLLGIVLWCLDHKQKPLPDAKGVHVWVFDFGRMHKSLRLPPSSAPVEPMIRYPETPDDLPKELYNFAYSSDDPPVNKELPGPEQSVTSSHAHGLSHCRFSPHPPLFQKASVIQQSFRYSARPHPD